MYEVVQKVKDINDEEYFKREAKLVMTE